MTNEERKALWKVQDEKVSKYGPGKYCLTALSKLEPRHMQTPSGEVREILFPTFAYLTELTVPTENRVKLTDITYYNARRIRNYLASIFRYRIPILWRTYGKDFAIYHSLGDDGDAGYYPYLLEPIWEKTQGQIDDWFKGGYSNAIMMLENIQSETILDICINLYGSAIWTEDLLDSYICRWRILEIIADQEIKRLKKARPDIINAYLTEKAKTIDNNDPCANEKAKVLGARDKIIICFGNMFPEEKLDATELREENKLRDDISHGDITTETYEKEFKYGIKVWELSRKFLHVELNNMLKTKAILLL